MARTALRTRERFLAQWGFFDSYQRWLDWDASLDALYGPLHKEALASRPGSSGRKFHAQALFAIRFPLIDRLKHLLL